MPLRHSNRIGTIEGEAMTEFPADPPPPYLSDTGQLAWYVEDGENGLVTVDTPRSQAIVGFVNANPHDTLHLKPEVKNDFCAITLSSLTDEPIQLSGKLLLTACAEWQNTGSVWNERRTLWDTWGEGPTLIQPVTGWLLLRELDGAVAVLVHPLDGAGRPVGEPQEGRRLEHGWEVELGTYPTNHYYLEVIK